MYFVRQRMQLQVICHPYAPALGHLRVPGPGLLQAAFCRFSLQHVSGVATRPFLCPLLFVIICAMNTSLLLTAHSFSLHLVSIYNHMRPFRGKRTRTRTHAVWRHPEFKQSMNISWVRQMRNLCHTNSQLPTHLHSLWWGGAGKAEGR